MLVRRDTLPIVESILRQTLMRSGSTSARDSIRVPMMLCLIGQGKFGEAMRILAADRPDSSSLGMVDAFNYGFAEWGLTRKAPCDFFARVIEIGRDLQSRDTGKNVLQCLSISAWVVGERDAASQFWDKASEVAVADSTHTFSAWRHFTLACSVPR